MEKVCGNCRHFKPMGLMDDKHKWGDCIKFEGGSADNHKESAFFRWGDDICVHFKAREDSTDLQNSTKQDGKRR